MYRSRRGVVRGDLEDSKNRRSFCFRRFQCFILNSSKYKTSMYRIKKCGHNRKTVVFFRHFFFQLTFFFLEFSSLKKLFVRYYSQYQSNIIRSGAK